MDRALHERWRAPKSRRDPITERLNQILENSEAKPRDVISACKAIVSACKDEISPTSRSSSSNGVGGQ